MPTAAGVLASQPHPLHTHLGNVRGLGAPAHLEAGFSGPLAG